MLQQLEKYSIRGNVLEMFQSYLTNRTQFVYVNGYKSDKMQVKCGVPQGSCLRPTLFSVYANDLPNITKFRVQLVADDTILIMTSNDLKQLEKTATEEINKIEKCLLLNQLTLNHSKLIICIFLLKKNVGRIFLFL